MSGLTRGLPDWLPTTRWDPHVGPGSVVVLLSALAGCWWVGGLPGVVVWAVVAVTWLLFPTIIPVAVAQFGLIVLLPDDPVATTILLAELPVVLLLFADLLEHAHSWIAGVVMLGLAAGGIGVVLGFGAGALVPVTLALIGAGGLASYLLHRYLLVQLELA